MTATNQTAALIDARCSTRAYAATPVTDDEKRARRQAGRIRKKAMDHGILRG